MNTEILETVIENGRVETKGGEFDRESLIVEVEFEAGERGLSQKEIEDAVEFALDHTRNS